MPAPSKSSASCNELTHVSGDEGLARVSADESAILDSTEDCSMGTSVGCGKQQGALLSALVSIANSRLKPAFIDEDSKRI